MTRYIPKSKDGRTQALRDFFVARLHATLRGDPPGPLGFYARMVPLEGAVSDAAPTPSPAEALAVCRAEMQLLRARLAARALFASLGFSRAG
jgi:hypothetical protein